MEGKMLKTETGKAIRDWLFHEVFCRWGCMSLIITDNRPPFLKAIAYLEATYGIRGIQNLWLQFPGKWKNRETALRRSPGTV